MTISKYFYLFLLVLLDLSNCVSCHDEEVWTTLPLETQKGARTFGCYVNGELFVKGKEALFQPYLWASYHKSSNSFSLECLSSDNQFIEMQLNDVKINRSIPISKVYFSPQNKIICNCFTGKETGEIIITKFDTIPGHAFGIVSGRFQFSAQCSDNRWEMNIIGDSTIWVTSGRFDTVLGIDE